MKFAQPIWLMITLMVIPILIRAFRCFNQARIAALKGFASERLLPNLTASVSPRLRLVKRWFYVLGMGLCLFSLARPQIGFRWEEAKRKGIDILFAVDTSRSMLAQDVSPDRLTRAKLAVLDLLAKLEGDRVGLIAFAGTSFLQCPLTLDYDAFRQSVEVLDSTIIPQGGTNLASAIQEAENTFSPGNLNHRILVLITDGEDLEANGIATAKAAAQRGVKVFTVGVGTPAGELIPVRNESGGVDFLKDEKGQVVKSRLDEATLRQIAEVTGGFYEPLGQQGQGLEAIYENGLAPMPKQELSSRMNKVYIERFQWPLALGIFFLVLEMLLGDRRRGGKFKIQSPGLKAAAFAPAVFLILHPSTLEGSPQSAEKAYRQGKFEEALLQYEEVAGKNPKRSELQFNLGSSAYKNGRFPEAATAFQKALHTDQVPLQQMIFYNLGNTQYRLGQQTEKTNPQQTIQNWQQALLSYESALKFRSDDADARFNYEYVKKKLEELQKQQQQQDQKNQQGGEKQQNDQSQDQKKRDSSDKSDPGDVSEEKKRMQEKKDLKNQQGDSPSQNQKDQQDPAGQPNQQARSDSQPMSDKDQSDQKARAQPRSVGDKKQANPLPAEREPRPSPGQMTREEARNLLDSLKGDEKKMPVARARSGQTGSNEIPKRDW